ncbi:MAG: class I SAM-dependent methyltransferase [Proteobacteria bacterium]|nr:class I SAM-dependent methyltransferase [Pseudomonadota bacterium]
MADGKLQSEHFERIDDSDDTLFYAEPRLVKHIDEPACEALALFYHVALPRGGAILDLMSSCVSHLPTDIEYSRVCGLGMNKVELDANPRLSDHLVHDLTENPTLPFADSEFDACIINVSVQYLIHPIQVFGEIARVLKPGSVCAASFSNRCFPTKAVAIWRAMDDRDHARLVEYYFVESGGFEEPELTNLSPNAGESDPLYVVSARRLGAAT